MRTFYVTTSLLAVLLSSAAFAQSQAPNPAPAATTAPTPKGNWRAPGSLQEYTHLTYGETTGFARSAVEVAKQAASEGTSTVRAEVRRMLDRRVDHGEACHAASSMRAAADKVSKNAPPLDPNGGDKLDSYADRVKDRPPKISGKQPSTSHGVGSLVLGLASLAAFLAYRTIKNTQAYNRGYRQPIAQHAIPRAHALSSPPAPWVADFGPSESLLLASNLH